MIIQILTENAGKARALVSEVAPRVAAFHGGCTSGCTSALEHALITAPDARDPALMAKLSAVAGRLLEPKSQVKP
jgi:5'-methylthioadenosine phosphorylase